MALGLTATAQPFDTGAATDPQRLLRALFLLPVTAILLWTVALTPFALLVVAPTLVLLARNAWPARRYFIAFSPRNRFPRNLPVLARWAALYSGAMLVMIILPPMSGSLRWGMWLALAAACLAFPLMKAWLRAHRVWRAGDDP
ncbi:hypothetical protein [Shimia ponticola]|uniref:hypothetical protein n=1 Tax=Shimia ponticola TaxID=2582893 RepID=UPI0011BD99A3|nr:hypothetical protein [Shimia ponticola]